MSRWLDDRYVAPVRNAKVHVVEPILLESRLALQTVKYLKVDALRQTRYLGPVRGFQLVEHT